jgi:hypothetical protein
MSRSYYYLYCVAHYNPIGSYIIPTHLVGHRYLQFVERVLSVLLEEVLLAVNQRKWLQRDGAPPHFLLDDRNHISTTLAGCWTGRGGFIPWSA